MIQGEDSHETYIEYTVEHVARDVTFQSLKMRSMYIEKLLQMAEKNICSSCFSLNKPVTHELEMERRA